METIIHQYSCKNSIDIDSNMIEVFENQYTENGALFTAQQLLYSLCETFAINTCPDRAYLAIDVRNTNDNILESFTKEIIVESAIDADIDMDSDLDDCLGL